MANMTSIRKSAWQSPRSERRNFNVSNVHHFKYSQKVSDFVQNPGFIYELIVQNFYLNNASYKIQNL